jgi:hypothetical protein
MTFFAWYAFSTPMPFNQSHQHHFIAHTPRLSSFMLLHPRWDRYVCTLDLIIKVLPYIRPTAKFVYVYCGLYNVAKSIARAAARRRRLVLLWLVRINLHIHPLIDEDLDSCD